MSSYIYDSHKRCYVPAPAAAAEKGNPSKGRRLLMRLLRRVFFCAVIIAFVVGTWVLVARFVSSMGGENNRENRIPLLTP